MENISIELEFGSVISGARLFDTNIAKKFRRHLPVTVNLMQWGEEFYGSIGVNLGEENPVADIPPGGIAYTSNGNYVCIFFGQRPSWAVEHIGQIADDQWRRLREIPDCRRVTIRASAGGATGFEQPIAIACFLTSDHLRSIDIQTILNKMPEQQSV